MKKTLILFALLSAACRGEREAEVTREREILETDTIPADDVAVSKPGLRPPEVKGDSVMLEGTWHRIAVHLVESPPGFEPAFYTYAPEDFAVHQSSSAEGTAWRFNARFGGTENPEAYLLVFFFPDGTSDSEARRRIDQLIADRTVVQRDAGQAKRYPWSEVEYSYQGKTKSGQPLLGSVALGRHNGRLFYFLTEYPAEYADGFGPRAQVILKEWRWAT